jgi:hypothetical protein
MPKGVVAKKRAVVAQIVQEEPVVDQTERDLGRWVARVLPAVTIVAAVAVGAAGSVAPAILILSAGALLGTIALLWASIRTLSGDAPLPEGFETLSVGAARTALAERKAEVLRTLKDLEHERAVGKIDEDDYGVIAAPYREEAKALMRQMEVDLEPLRAKAEEVARKYLAKQGLGTPVVAAPEAADPPNPPEPVAAAKTRVCEKCTTTNDEDAAFCKKCGAALTSPTDEERDAHP